MFGNLIFVIIALLLISLAPESNGDTWITSPGLAFTLGMTLYAVTLGLIFFENRWGRWRRTLMLTLANLQLIAFLAIFHFILAAHRFLPNYSAIISLFSLSLYFFGLALFHYRTYRYQNASTKEEHPTPSGYTSMQVRILIPFIIPFALFSVLVDIGTEVQFFENHADSYWGMILLFSLSLFFLGLMMVFIPGLIQLIWKCQPLEDELLHEKLEDLCKRADFKHAGMKTWTILNHALTAGIIGVVPWFRYVMFTRRLLREMSHEQIEAILAHEIAHSKKKHLIIYPFVIFGMILTATLFSLFFGETLTEYLALKNLETPSTFWAVMEPFAIFVPYALIIALYIRFVFGYFSRLFERQADLNVFELGVPYYYMLQALDHIGKATGNTHRHPSWHHYSIQQRINFLCDAALHPHLITQHNRRVKRNVFAYFFLLFSLLILIVIPIPPIENGIKVASHTISNYVTANTRSALADRAIKNYQLSGNKEKIHKALMQSYSFYPSTHYTGIPEFAAASLLYDEKEYRASALLMAAAWDHLDPRLRDNEIQQDFRELSEKILKVAPSPEWGVLRDAFSP